MKKAKAKKKLPAKERDELLEILWGRVFVYHNGAQSYYGAGGFRGLLRV